MIHIPYMLFPLLLVVLGCAKDQSIEYENLECLALTVDDSLFTYLAADTLPIYPCVEIDLDHNGPILRLVQECLNVRIRGGCTDKLPVINKLVWNGEFTNDTAHVYFQIYNPNILPGQEYVQMSWHKDLSFDIEEIVRASDSEKLFLQTHCYDAHFDNRYRILIQLR